MSTMQSRLEASIQQAKHEIEYNIDCIEHGGPDTISFYKVQLIDWKDRLANLTWIQTGEIIGLYQPVAVD